MDHFEMPNTVVSWLVGGDWGERERERGPPRKYTLVLSVINHASKILDTKLPSSGQGCLHDTDRMSRRWAVSLSVLGIDLSDKFLHFHVTQDVRDYTQICSQIVHDSCYTQSIFLRII